MVSELTLLLPTSSYLLPYTLPLLLFSLVLTLAGTFLTLDRSRSFAPKYPGAFDKPKRFRFALEGGIGGLLIGYASGVHTSTFLALLVPSVSSSSSLSPASFVAVWLLPSLFTTFLAGRWKYCSLAFAGFLGGALFALALSVIIHPSLLTRIVLMAIFAPVLTVMVLLPIPRLHHNAVRFATSSLGAFGVTVAIALLAHIPAWANVWERLWDTVGTDWGTRQEQGLSAGFCLFLCVGIVSDWLLHRSFGECPDEKWDNYLANYAVSIPNQADRTGTFRPFVSAWDRLFGTHIPSAAFPDTDSKIPISTLFKRQKYQNKELGGEWKQGIDMLRKKSRPTKIQSNCGRKTREAVKFKPIGDSSGSESDDEPLVPGRPWLRPQSSKASTDTLVDQHKETDSENGLEPLEQVKSKSLSAGLGDGETPEYSDYEEDKDKELDDDITALKLAGGWSPKFMRRDSASRSMSGTTIESTHSRPSQPLAAVPATPSLIKALDRVAVAQKEAFELQPRKFTRSPSPDEERDHWDGFWRDVNEKKEKVNS